MQISGEISGEYRESLAYCSYSSTTRIHNAIRVYYFINLTNLFRRRQHILVAFAISYFTRGINFRVALHRQVSTINTKSDIATA